MWGQLRIYVLFGWIQGQWLAEMQLSMPVILKAICTIPANCFSHEHKWDIPAVQALGGFLWNYKKWSLPRDFPGEVRCQAYCKWCRTTLLQGECGLYYSSVKLRHPLSGEFHLELLGSVVCFQREGDCRFQQCNPALYSPSSPTMTRGCGRPLRLKQR